VTRLRAFLRDCIQVISGLRREKPGKRLCPACGSPEIRLSDGWSGWLTPERFTCRKCGYTGPLVMELCSEADSTEETA